MPQVAKLKSGPVRLRGGTRVNLATVSCPGDSCVIRDRRANLRIFGRKSVARVRVVGPRRIAAGKTAKLGVRVPSRLVSRLNRGRRSGMTAVFVKVSLEDGGRTVRNLRMGVMR